MKNFRYQFDPLAAVKNNVCVQLCEGDFNFHLNKHNYTL